MHDGDAVALNGITHRIPFATGMRCASGAGAAHKLVFSYAAAHS